MPAIGKRFQTITHHLHRLLDILIRRHTHTHTHIHTFTHTQARALAAELPADVTRDVEQRVCIHIYAVFH